MKLAIAFCFLLAGTPFAVSQADDEETQQLHSNTYQQVVQSTNCIYQGDCSLAFPKTDHITTAITAVSCFFTLPPGTTVVYASVGSETASPRFYLQAFPYGYSNGSITYGINGVTNLFINKGDQPRIDIYSDGAPVTLLSCTISGYHS
jgi:hypothetical protein